MEPKKWRFGSDDLPFQTGDFQVNQPLIFQGVYTLLLMEEILHHLGYTVYKTL